MIVIFCIYKTNAAKFELLFERNKNFRTKITKMKGYEANFHLAS